LTRESGVWVLYQNKVYDITLFLDEHPGGAARILEAAGQDIEPYWQKYRRHYSSPRAQLLLDDLQIGVLHADDVAVLSNEVSVRSELDQELFRLRRAVNTGAAGGAVFGATVGALVYIASQKVKQMKHLQWSSRHRTASILIGGSLGAMIGAFVSGKQTLAARPELHILLDASATATNANTSGISSGENSPPPSSPGSYRKIQTENRLNELARIEESFARRSETLDMRRKKEQQQRRVEE
jgi:cytochrome b involved in lipid metabolism